MIFIHELDIRISDFGPDQRAHAPFRRQNRTQEYFSISSGLRAHQGLFSSCIATRVDPQRFQIQIFFQPKSFFLKKAGETLNLLIKARRRKFEDFSFKIVRKCFRNALVFADFGSGSVKIFRLRRAFLLKK